MQIGSVVWEEFYHIHSYIHTYTRNLANVAVSIRVTLNTKPVSQVLIKLHAWQSPACGSCDANALAKLRVTGPKFTKVLSDVHEESSTCCDPVIHCEMPAHRMNVGMPIFADSRRSNVPRAIKYVFHDYNLAFV